MAGIEETPEGGLRRGLGHQQPRGRRPRPGALSGLDPGDRGRRFGQLRNKATTAGNPAAHAMRISTTPPSPVQALLGSGRWALRAGTATRRLARATPASPRIPRTWPSPWSPWTLRSKSISAIRRHPQLPLMELHRLPAETPQIDTHPIPGELITAVMAPASQGRSAYRKVRDRAAPRAWPAWRWRAVGWPWARWPTSPGATRTPRPPAPARGDRRGAGERERQRPQRLQDQPREPSGPGGHRRGAREWEGRMSSVLDWEATPIPSRGRERRQHRQGGRPLRTSLKVTGTAPYAYEVEPPSPPAYGVMISAGMGGSPPPTPPPPRPRRASS